MVYLCTLKCLLYLIIPLKAELSKYKVQFIGCKVTVTKARIKNAHRGWAFYTSEDLKWDALKGVILNRY